MFHVSLLIRDHVCVKCWYNVKQKSINENFNCPQGCGDGFQHPRRLGTSPVHAPHRSHLQRFSPILERLQTRCSQHSRVATAAAHPGGGTARQVRHDRVVHRRPECRGHGVERHVSLPHQFLAVVTSCSSCDVMWLLRLVVAVVT